MYQSWYGIDYNLYDKIYIYSDILHKRGK